MLVVAKTVCVSVCIQCFLDNNPGLLPRLFKIHHTILPGRIQYSTSHFFFLFVQSYSMIMIGVSSYHLPSKIIFIKSPGVPCSFMHFFLLIKKKFRCAIKSYPWRVFKETNINQSERKKKYGVKLFFLHPVCCNQTGLNVCYENFHAQLVWLSSWLST